DLLPEPRRRRRIRRLDGASPSDLGVDATIAKAGVVRIRCWGVRYVRGAREPRREDVVRRRVVRGPAGEAGLTTGRPGGAPGVVGDELEPRLVAEAPEHRREIAAVRPSGGDSEGPDRDRLALRPGRRYESPCLREVRPVIRPSRIGVHGVWAVRPVAVGVRRGGLATPPRVSLAAGGPGGV